MGFFRSILRYGPFTALRSDIMGPFRFFAGMQCSHGIISMGHSLSGNLELNSERLDFSDGIGYIETDRGRSFPSKYLWTQCIWNGAECGSLMLALRRFLPCVYLPVFIFGYSPAEFERLSWQKTVAKPSR